MPDNKQSAPDNSSKAEEKSAQKDPGSAAKFNSCKTCRAFGTLPPCKGHGGKGGGGSSGGGSGEKAGKSEGQTPANIPGQLIKPVGQMVANVTIQAMDSKKPIQQDQLNKKTFNQEIISDLLSKKMLLIDNNRDSGILTIKLQCNPNLLSEGQKEELNEFIYTILEELDELKKDKSIPSNCVKIETDNDDNFLSLRIALPTPELYKAFIEKLASKNLLPVQNIEQEEKIVYKEGMNHFNPTPLSMKPTPNMNKNLKLTDEEKQKEEKNNTFKKEDKSSSIRPRSPLDGLKPPGWK